MATGFDTTKKYAPDSLGSVLILGLGKSGKAASTYCAALIGSRVDSCTVYAGAANEANESFACDLRGQGATVLFDTEQVEGSYDVCIASPGISENSAFYQAAVSCSTEVISEVEFAWRESDAESVWLAITGTNGKTTTTALAAHILQTCGKNASAVGNIGDTCLEAVANGKTACYVVEVSSYQLASTKRFKPDVAVLLNITPDHLKWHGSFEAYAQAKQKIYANCDSSCTVVLDATNDVVREFVKAMRADGSREHAYVPMGTAQGISGNMCDVCGSENAAYLNAKGVLCVDFSGAHHELCAAGDLQIKGEHNASNALAAAAGVVALGCADEDIIQGLVSFEPIAHRIEPCGSVAGVACYNDSKATNVDATLKALAAFGDDKPVVLLGGDDKGTDLTELVEQADHHCKAVVCFGAAGPRFLQAFKAASIPVYEAQRMKDAFDVALSCTVPGDIIVLSPACASFDEFTGYPERGNVFKDLVAQRSRERGA